MEYCNSLILIRIFMSHTSATFSGSTIHIKLDTYVYLSFLLLNYFLYIFLFFISLALFLPFSVCAFGWCPLETMRWLSCASLSSTWNNYLNRWDILRSHRLAYNAHGINNNNGADRTKNQCIIIVTFYCNHLDLNVFPSTDAVDEHSTCNDVYLSPERNRNNGKKTRIRMPPLQPNEFTLYFHTRLRVCHARRLIIILLTNFPTMARWRQRLLLLTLDSPLCNVCARNYHPHNRNIPKMLWLMYKNILWKMKFPLIYSKYVLARKAKKII